MLSKPRHLIISILCGNELINIAATANMTGILVTLYGGERAAVISLLVMVSLLLLSGEITPKTIAVSYPDQLSTRIVAGPLSVWVRLITPLRWGIRLVADRVLVYNLLDAGNTEVEHIMTPRTQIQFVAADENLSKTAEEIVAHHRLRLPVFGDTQDDVQGFLFTEDLMALKLSGKSMEDLTCRDILRPALFVPPTKSVDEMLDFFQVNEERAAMVINEFAGISGIVTMEDVINFIFSEIAEEFVDPSAYEKESDQVYVMSAQMKLIDFEALTNFGIEAPRVTTIGGVAYRHFGRIPRENDHVTFHGIRISVLETEDNRLARLRVAKLDGSETPDENALPISDDSNVKES